MIFHILILFEKEALFKIKKSSFRQFVTLRFLLNDQYWYHFVDLDKFIQNLCMFMDRVVRSKLFNKKFKKKC